MGIDLSNHAEQTYHFLIIIKEQTLTNSNFLILNNKAEWLIKQLNAIGLDRLRNGC